MLLSVEKPIPNEHTAADDFFIYSKFWQLPEAAGREKHCKEWSAWFSVREPQDRQYMLRVHHGQFMPWNPKSDSHSMEVQMPGRDTWFHSIHFAWQPQISYLL